ncbi:MAG: hypothetical protein AB200_02035 [Parcubacteria bacterium C7867-005]|nr:MAG: hypothetical protein AB200_02035 [Parcubacteria bacterium C7867-005]
MTHQPVQGAAVDSGIGLSGVAPGQHPSITAGSTKIARLKELHELLRSKGTTHDSMELRKERNRIFDSFLRDFGAPESMVVGLFRCSSEEIVIHLTRWKQDMGAEVS